LDDVRPDREFSIKGDIMFISRYIPDMSENRRYNREHNQYRHVYKSDLIQREVGDIAVKMKLQEIGQLDSLCFITNTKSLNPLGPDEVEFRVKASTINPKGVFEHVGTVLRVGDNVSNIFPGDTVVSCWSGDYGTMERAPPMLAKKSQPKRQWYVRPIHTVLNTALMLKIGRCDDASGLHDGIVCISRLSTITKE
jgi:hypothetical protein